MFKYFVISASLLFCQLAYSADYQKLASQLTAQGDALTKAAADKAPVTKMKELETVIAGHEDMGGFAPDSSDMDRAYRQIIRAHLTRTFLSNYYSGGAKMAVVVRASFALFGSSDHQLVVHRLAGHADSLARAIADKVTDAEWAGIVEDLQAEVDQSSSSLAEGGLDEVYQEIVRIDALRKLVRNHYSKSETKAIILEAALVSISD